jgi:hypothetical protein
MKGFSMDSEHKVFVAFFALIFGLTAVIAFATSAYYLGKVKMITESGYCENTTVGYASVVLQKCK